MSTNPIDILYSISTLPNFPYLEISKDLISQINYAYQIINYLNKNKTKVKIDFYSSIQKRRVDINDLEYVINILEDLRIKNNLNIGIMGSLDLILNLYKKLEGSKSSNVIDIVTKSKEDIEIIREELLKIGAYNMNPDIYKICFSYNEKTLCIPNQIGYYSYLSFKDKKVHILVTNESNIVLQKSKYDTIYFLNNFTLFTLIYKFYRFSQKDQEDLKKLEENLDYEKWKNLQKYFDEEDKKKVLEIFGDKGRKRIIEKYKSYINTHQNSIYREINPELILR
ncbi:hypothetical protein YN1_1590 [Nanoarchaeota archaeon]